MSEAPDSSLRADNTLGAARELFDRRRLVVMLALLLLEVAIFAAGLLTPVSGTFRQAIENQTSTQFASVPSATAPQLFSFIFVHNLPIALVEMVPLLGAIVFASSIYVTGVAAQVSVAAQGYPGPFGGVLLLFPFTFVEFAAYAIAVGAGVMLVFSWIRGRLRREVVVFSFEAVAVAIVLLVAALMETATKFSALIGLALWVPTGLAVLGIVAYSWRSRA
jgi:hypothetical protein